MNSNARQQEKFQKIEGKERVKEKQNVRLAGSERTNIKGKTTKDTRIKNVKERKRDNERQE